MLYRNCSTQNSAQRQRCFEIALLSLMEQKPYSTISISEICRQASLSRKCFYHYFPGKDGCLCALIDHTVLGYHSHQQVRPNGRLSMTSCLLYWKEHRLLLEALCQNHMAYLMLDRMLFYASTEEGFRTYMAGEHTDGTREQVVLWVGGLFTVLLEWHKSDYEKDAQELGGILDQLLDKLG